MSYGDGPSEAFGQEAQATLDAFKCGLCGKEYQPVQDFYVEELQGQPGEDPAHWRIEFAGLWIGQCCFAKFERIVMWVMPELLAWWQPVLRGGSEFLEHVEALLDAREPTTPRYPNFKDLYVFLGRTAPDNAKCGICGQVSSGGGDSDSIELSHLGPIDIVYCCFERVAAAISLWMSKWLPWYRQLVEERHTEVMRQRSQLVELGQLLVAL